MGVTLGTYHPEQKLHDKSIGYKSQVQIQFTLWAYLSCERQNVWPFLNIAFHLIVQLFQRVHEE